MANIFPAALLEKLSQYKDFDASSFIATHESGTGLTSVRINPSKNSGQFQDMEKVSWCETGRYLTERPSFVADPLFHAGCYYVQEASSMFIEQAIKQTVDLSQPIRALDLCAAPGGKSTLIASLLNEDSMLVSNEIIKSRVPILSDNLTRWGNLNTVVSNNDPKDFGRIEAFFDLIVIDAPCSGSGMFRKDNTAIQEWSENNVQLCSERQQRILANVYPALKKGGCLIYSTCSYSEEENEFITDWLRDNYKLRPVKIPTETEWGITEHFSPKHQVPGYRFYPHKVKGEGFFLSCFIKEEGEEEALFNAFKPAKGNQQEQSIIRTWLRPNDTLWLLPIKEGYTIVRKDFLDDIQFLQTKLYLRKAGVFAGKVVGKDLIPEHELALSHLVNEEIHRLSLSRENAIKYLRRDVLNVSSDVKGWTLMQYEGFNLGWAKVLPNRINNYYPKEIRIIKEVL